jgi:hypothetical protein
MLIYNIIKVFTYCKSRCPPHYFRLGKRVKLNPLSPPLPPPPHSDIWGVELK